MAARGRCWTCKDRKVSCDRTVPICLKCSTTDRHCGGYDLRLTWPCPRDQKRATISIPWTLYRSNHTPDQAFHLINASSWDLALHYVSSDNISYLRERPEWKRLDVPLTCPLTLWVEKIITPSDQDLLEYFQRDGIHVVPMFDIDRDRFCRILMRIAFSDRSLASKAVLQSILALSSLYRDGVQPFAVQLKHAALQTLMDSVKEGIDTEAAIKHIAAGVLSCCFEMHLKMNGDTWNSQWVGHMVGAKELIRDVNKPSQHLPGSDNSILLGWVYYYDMATRFSLRHWRTHLVSQALPELAFDPARDKPCQLQTALARTSFASPVPQFSDHAPPVLGLLSEICDTILYPWDSQYHSIEYQDYLKSLETRLETLQLSVPCVGKAPQDLTRVTDLFRLAGLIYLERASKSFSGQSTKVEQWNNKAFAIIASIGRCRHPLPIFIIGCEARSDLRRQSILDLIEKTEEDPRVRNMNQLRDLLQSFWVQDDLDVEGEVEYIRKVNMVVSSCTGVPNFV